MMSHRRAAVRAVGVAIATVATAVSGSLLGLPALADDQPWLDVSLPADTRAQLMTDQMTLEEKSALLYGYGTRTIEDQTWQVYVKGNERLGIPDMVQGDTPAGIWQGSSDVTQLPASVALGATFSRDAAATYGDVLGTETRALGYGVLHGPNVDVLRDPRHGRAHESFGEDPWLNSAIGTEYVKAVQEHDVIADAKHFVVNTVEKDRQTVDAQMSRKTLEELYLFPFQDVVQDAGVGMLMCAYNKINGTHACNDEYILQTVLRERWGFEGIVRTDAGAAHTLQSLALGVDQEFRSESQYGKVLIAAVKNGSFPMEAVDAGIRRILVTMIKYGIFDNPPERTGAPLKEDAAKAQSVAEESIVLLKNQREVLPLDDDAKRIAVIGTSANDTLTHGGPANPSPTGKTTVVQAITGQVPTAEISYNPGVDPIYAIATDPGLPQLASGALTAANGSHGADAQYSNSAGAQIAQQLDSCLCVSPSSQFSGTVTTAQPIPAGMASATWSSTLMADASGEYAFDAHTRGAVEVRIDGQVVLQKPTTPDARLVQGSVELASGEHELTVSFTGHSSFKLGWRPPAGALDANIRAAAEAAASADVAVLVARDLESEGADRPSLTLPNDQDRLISAVLDANPNTVIVLTTGSAVTMPWESKAATIVEAWYGGTRGANAISAVLFGDVNPSGRLPVTFPKSDADLPTANPAQFPGINRVAKFSEGLETGYRHFNQPGATQPLFPFGHGLSYSTFAYEDLKLEKKSFEIGIAGDDGTFKGQEAVTVKVTVRNTGDVAGSLVPQLYVQFPDASGQPTPVLRAFDKIHLAPGEKETVKFVLDQRAFSNFNEAADAWVVDQGAFEVLVGNSSTDVSTSGSVVAENKHEHK